MTQPFASTLGPNDTWCIDFKGKFRMQDGNWCHVLTLLGADTRYPPSWREACEVDRYGCIRGRKRKLLVTSALAGETVELERLGEWTWQIRFFDLFIAEPGLNHAGGLRPAVRQIESDRVRRRTARRVRPGARWSTETRVTSSPPARVHGHAPGVERMVRYCWFHQFTSWACSSWLTHTWF